MIRKIERARSQSQLVQIHNSSSRHFQLQLLLNLMNITITFFSSLQLFWHTRNNQDFFGFQQQLRQKKTISIYQMLSVKKFNSLKQLLFHLKTIFG